MVKFNVVSLSTKEIAALSELSKNAKSPRVQLKFDASSGIGTNVIAIVDDIEYDITDVECW